MHGRHSVIRALLAGGFARYMDREMLPRFVASTHAPSDPAIDDPTAIEDVRCVVRLRGTELVIGTAAGGAVHITDDRSRLAHRALAQLSFHEVASGRVLELDADELYVFDLLTLEILPDAPGVNDALYLYGAMKGRYPAKEGSAVALLDGQLTVTRGDLLDGLVDGFVNAFAYAPDMHGSRCVHALLPGDRAETIERGRGIVLALPLVPDWVLECPTANDVVVGQVIYDVLNALRTDLGITEPLPVPSRDALEQKLVATGWQIEGNQAVRPRGRGIGKLFSKDERRTLPPQGTLDELVAEAKTVLARIPGIPSQETMALRRRFLRPPSPVAVPAPARIPVQSSAMPPPPHSAATPALSPGAAPRPHVRSDRSEWMRDFIDAHRSPSRPAPQVVTPSRAVSREATPTWMNDFDEPMPIEPGTPDENEPATPRPDWSKDFD